MNTDDVYQQFLNYLYENKKIKKNSDFLIEENCNKNFDKEIYGFPGIKIRITESYVQNIETVNIGYTAFIITIIQKKNDDTLNNLINFFIEVENDLKIKKINKKYEITPESSEMYSESKLYYISPHKADDWYVN